MKQALKRCLLALLVIMLALPILPANVISAAAKKPTLSPAKITLVGEGATNNLKLNNVDMSKVKRLTWYSQNEKVAIVEPTTAGKSLTGKVTAVGKGKTNVRVKITYKDGKVVRPNCSVTVQIAAKEVVISNKKLNANNEHTIVVGESYDFNRKLTPSNANDKTYWFLEDLGKGLATVDTKGIVRALKPGLVRLTAKASITKAGAESSKVTDSVLISIVEKSAQVVEVKLVNSTTLKITFNNPINPATVLDNTKVKDSVKIIASLDENGQVAKNLGEITGSLSIDGKELTINTTNGFNGLYRVELSSQIKSVDGLSLIPYNQNLGLQDNTPPVMVGTTYDETGLKATILFSEPISITDMKVGEARRADGVGLLPDTKALLERTASYVLSKDRKSLTIDLSYIPYSEQNKDFEVKVTGIKDEAGNNSSPYVLTMTFKADTSPKPQARLLDVKRTGTNELMATFDRAIQLPGYLKIVSSNETLIGAINPDNNRQVKYAILTPTSVGLPGMQLVRVIGWSGFNVATTEPITGPETERTVNFNVELSLPTLLTTEFRSGETGDYVLTLTYDKNVALSSYTGYFDAKFTNTNRDISNPRLNYTAIAKEKEVYLYFTKEQIVNSGEYMLTLPQGFVKDSYGNQSGARPVVFRKDASVSSELPSPKAIIQATENRNILYVKFAHKVDEATARDIRNYSIPDVTILSADLRVNNDVEGAEIMLTLAPNTIILDTQYPVSITNIAGYHNTFTEMKPYREMVFLRENTAPSIKNIEYVYPSTIILTFSESIVGTPSFKVLQGNENLAYSYGISGSTLHIYLRTEPAMNTQLIVEPNSDNVIRDEHGNISVISQQKVFVTRKY